MNIFVSHSASDAPFAAALAHALEQEGLDVWQAHKDVFPGDNVWLKTGEALERAQAMVVVISAGTSRSTNVEQEVSFALGSTRFRGRVVSVILGDAVRVPWILQTFPMIRASRRSPARAARAVASQLRTGTRKAAS